MKQCGYQHLVQPRRPQDCRTTGRYACCRGVDGSTPSPEMFLEAQAQTAALIHPHARPVARSRCSKHNHAKHTASLRREGHEERRDALP
eukprot:11656954-Alexandrium_andersonii.AAC.2